MAWRVGADRDLPIEYRDEWDGQAAQDSIFEWAGWPDEPNEERARRCFLTYDDEEPENKGSYKLPFAMVIDGEPYAIDAGITAAAQRLSQTDIPDDVMERAGNVIDHYQERIEEEQSEDEQAKGKLLAFRFPARIVARRAMSQEQLMDLFSTKLMDGDGEDEEPFFFRAEISSNRLDAYYTRMMESSLRNYAAEAETGVPFCDSHDTWKLNFGRTLTGVYESAGEEDEDGTPIQRVMTDIYTVPDMEIGQVKTNSIIRGIRTGILQDVSIGFYGGQYICSICGEDMFDWYDLRCPHYPGVMYEWEDDDEVVRTQMAIGQIEDAHLSEVSAVYDGATPGAMIQKAERLMKSGKMNRDTVQMLERRYRMQVPRTHQWRGADLPPKSRATDVPDEVGSAAGEQPATAQVEESNAQSATHRKEITMDILEQQRAALLELGLPEELDDEAQIRWLIDRAKHARSADKELETVNGKLAEAEAEVKRLQPLALDGEAFRCDFVKRALAEGVRANGEDFDQDTYRNLLESTDISIVKRMHDDWKRIGDARFAGGRQTEEPKREEAQEDSDDDKTPNAAYTV